VSTHARRGELAYNILSVCSLNLVEMVQGLSFWFCYQHMEADKIYETE